MQSPVIRCERVSKKFSRKRLGFLLAATIGQLSQLVLRKPAVVSLRPDEFWALHDITFEAYAGECIGIIGPNGAGKSTLLKLINGDYQPDHGQVHCDGPITSLVRLGDGLQPMLTGRENIYIKCAERGLSKVETDSLIGQIASFSGLDRSLDDPVKNYSDGMYARLEFSIATCVPMDILLIDEVLAVGDVGFQMRCLQRLDQLKQSGTVILFVSHSEMNVRYIADRCLLLFDGELLGLGKTDALFRKYYEATGFLDRALQPLGIAPGMPADFGTGYTIKEISVSGQAYGGKAAVCQTGAQLTLSIRYRCLSAHTYRLILQFWSSTGLLIGFYDSHSSAVKEWVSGQGVATLDLPFVGLTAGSYRVAGGFLSDQGWLSYQSDLLVLRIQQTRISEAQGLFALQGRLSVRPDQ